MLFLTIIFYTTILLHRRIAIDFDEECRFLYILRFSSSRLFHLYLLSEHIYLLILNSVPMSTALYRIYRNGPPSLSRNEASIYFILHILITVVESNMPFYDWVKFLLNLIYQKMLWKYTEFSWFSILSIERVSSILSFDSVSVACCIYWFVSIPSSQEQIHFILSWWGIFSIFCWICLLEIGDYVTNMFIKVIRI